MQTSPAASASISAPGETEAPPLLAPETPRRPAAIPAHRASSHTGEATLSAVQSLSTIIVIAIFIVTFTVQPFRIPSASMEPTLLVGDFLLVTKREPAPAGLFNPFPDSTIRRGDIVVFHFPIDPALHLVKRVIGLPGDRIRMRGGRVFLNGAELDEPYAVYTRSRADSFRDNFPHLTSTDPDVDAHWWIRLHTLLDNGDLKVPPGEYFVLGDNRNNSEDSRYWGLVPRETIVGEPLLVYFSLRDPGSRAELPRDALAQTSGLGPQHRSLGEALLDAARWDRTLHVVR